MIRSSIISSSDIVIYIVLVMITFAFEGARIVGFEAEPFSVQTTN